METLVANLKLAMGDRIRANSWMAPATKDAALAKLAKMDVMVGYPDKWRDYSALKIDPTDLYGNVKRSSAFEYAYALGDLNKPVDRKKWAMNPQEVNAYNGGLENKIVFPAGILQAPYFSESVDDAVNYGAIGAVIGHEIIHGFDDQGRKIDASGAVRDWWTAEDAAKFDAAAKAFGAQYATYEAAPGAFINPDLTMGENIADLAGLEVAYDAYHRSLGGKPAPVIDGLTGDQRFFLAFAQAWRDKAARRCDQAAGRKRSAQPGALAHHRAGAQRRCLVQGIQRSGGCEILSEARGAHQNLVSPETPFSGRGGGGVMSSPYRHHGQRQRCADDHEQRGKAAQAPTSYGCRRCPTMRRGSWRQARPLRPTRL